MADNGNEQETIQCSRCKKRWFADGFRVNRLGRRNKTCLECNAKKKAERERAKQDPEKVAKNKAERERAKQDPEKVAKMKAAKARQYERIKNDPERLAARRLQQVLANYAKEFPDDPRPPTTQEEVNVKRERHRLLQIVKGGLRRGTLQHRLDILEKEGSPECSRDLATKLRSLMAEVELGLQEFGF